MYAVRLWSVRHSRKLEAFYQGFENLLLRLAPVWRRLGHARLERPIAAFERGVKGLLFDCQMCGQCALSSTGMSCPMNCPKGLRNGPCGGVRMDGTCEIRPSMPCVWVKAFEGLWGHQLDRIKERAEHRAREQTDSPIPLKPRKGQS